MRAHLGGGAGADLGDGCGDGGVAVAVEERGEAGGADEEGGGLGADVADALVGDADVGGDDRVDFRVEPAALEELDRREAQALLLGRRWRRRRSRRGPMPPVSGQWPVLESQHQILSLR